MSLQGREHIFTGSISGRSRLRFVEVATQIGYEIACRLATGKLQLLSDTGEILNLTDSEVHRKWLAHEWEIDTASLVSSKDAIYITVPRDLGTYPESQQKEAKRRKHYLDKLDPGANPYRRDAERERGGGR